MSNERCDEVPEVKKVITWKEVADEMAPIFAKFKGISQQEVMEGVAAAWMQEQRPSQVLTLLGMYVSRR